MNRKREFFYPSADGETRIHAIEWIPPEDIKAVLQISHGMVEYIDRYDEFASWLADRGWYVVGNDHLGHGKSVTSREKYGFFHVPDGNRCVIQDIHTLRERTGKRYPCVPYFMLGHSMGSFLLRQYLQTHGRGLAGAVIMGTGYKSRMLLQAGQILCRLIAFGKGWHYRSCLIDRLGLGSYNRSFEPCESSRAWVTSDEGIRSKYEEDPLCSFSFTLNGYEQMFEGMKQITGKRGAVRVPRTLPVLFVSGKQDPVGNFGKDVEKVYHLYQKAGIKDVTLRFYENDRHEVLNEQDRQQVYEDIWNWMEQRREGGC